jgi:flagellar FliL protein
MAAAEETAAADGAAPEAPAAAKGGMGKLALIGGAVLVLAGGAGAAWKLGVFGHAKKAETAAAEGEAKEDEKPSVGAIVPLDPFIANLADEDGKRYLKATLQVEFFGPRVPDEFNTRLPQVRDLVLTLLTSKLFADIRTPEGKTVLRDEIINRMNRSLNNDLVKAVYFTEFIVQ